MTSVWAIALFFLLPDSPLNARWLTPRQRIMAQKRHQDQVSSRSKHWKWSQFLEALRDPKSWLLSLFMLSVCIPNGALTNFGSILGASFGFSTFDTLLLGMPLSAIDVGCVLGFSYLATKFPYSRCLIIAFLMLSSTAGVLMVMLLPTTQKWNRVGGLWLYSSFAGVFPVLLSLVATNITGYTKKATVGGMVFIGLNVGNIIGPNLFFTTEAPKYMVCYSSL